MKVEVAVLVSPSLIVRMVSGDVNNTELNFGVVVGACRQGVTGVQ